MKRMLSAPRGPYRVGWKELCHAQGVVAQSSESRFKLKALISFLVSNFETMCFQARVKLALPHQCGGVRLPRPKGIVDVQVGEAGEQGPCGDHAIRESSEACVDSRAREGLNVIARVTQKGRVDSRARGFYTIRESSEAC